MATCDLTRGFNTGCLDGSGGGIDIFLVNYDTLFGTITYDPTTGAVDGLGTATVYRYTGTKNSVSFTDTPAPNQENGTMAYNQTATVKIPKAEQAKHREILGIAGRAKMMVFVRTSSNQIILLGRFKGMYLDAASSAGSGLAATDFDGYNLTFSAEESEQGVYLEAYTSLPFDNFVNITVSPDFDS